MPKPRLYAIVKTFPSGEGDLFVTVRLLPMFKGQPLVRDIGKTFSRPHAEILKNFCTLQQAQIAAAWNDPKVCDQLLKEITDAASEQFNAWTEDVALYHAERESQSRQPSR